MDNLTISFIKDTILNLLNEEATKEDVDIKVYNITYIGDLIKNKYNLQKETYRYICNEFKSKAGVYMLSTREIFIFLNDYKVRLKNELSEKENYFAECIHTAFHEFRHAIQFQKFGICGTLENFIYDIEDLIKFYVPEHYDNRHDDYFSEIDANLYAIEKTSEFFINNPSLLKQNKIYLTKNTKKYNYQYTNYDFDDFFSLFCDILKKEPNLINRYGIYMKTLFDNNGNIKSIESLLSHETLNCVDIRVIYKILSSDEFLNELKVPVEEQYKQMVLDALNYRLTLTKLKYDSNVEFPKSEKRYREEQERLSIIIREITEGKNIITQDVDFEKSTKRS